MVEFNGGGEAAVHRWMLHPIPVLSRRRAITPPGSQHTAIMVIGEPG
jgi:hypothetical protein